MNPTQNNDSLNELSPKKSHASYAMMGAGAFLAIVVLFTAYFVYRNMSLENDIAAEKKRWSEYQTSIVALKMDPVVQAAEILAQAKPEIIKNIESSIVSNYVREIDKIHRDYLIQFTGFAYQGGHINTSVNAEKGLADDAIRKVIKLVGDYRNNTYSGSLQLEPITSVNGDESKRSFGVEFKTK